MLKFFKDQLLGPLVIAFIFFIIGTVAQAVDRKIIIHLLGGVADGDTIRIRTITDPGRIMSLPANSSDGPVQAAAQNGDIATQKWTVEIAK